MKRIQKHKNHEVFEIKENALLIPYVVYDNEHIHYPTLSLVIEQIDGTTLKYYKLDKITNELITSIPNIKSAWINCPIVGNAAFYNNKTIESVYFTKNVEEFEGKTVIQKGQFENCSNLKYIRLNSDIKLSQGAFYATSVENVIIPKNFKVIEANMFDSCSKLKSIILPDTITKIGNQAFAACKSLSSITIPNNVTSIGIQSFLSCSSLTEVSIPDNVTTLGHGAFYKCTSLIKITFPNTIKNIGQETFRTCSKLSSITYNGTISQWNTITKGTNWKDGVPSTCIVHCTDGDINI